MKKKIIVYNPDNKVGVLQIYPQGTNSTMFTECCKVAICDGEGCCPKCNREIIGNDAKTSHKRGKIRWNYATFHWK